MTSTARTRRWLAAGVCGALFLSLAAPSSAAPLGLASASVRPEPGSPDSGDSLFPHQGNGGYDVKRYQISLTWHRSGAIRATTVLSARARQALSAFNVDLDGLRVRSVGVDGSPATFRRSGSELTIVPRRPIRNGAIFTAVVRYAGRPHPYIDPDGSRDGWVATRDGATVVAEPVGSMTWFPSNDTLRDKARYLLKITAPRALTVESNGRLLGRDVHGRTATWTWREIDKTASYLASVSIGRYDVVHARTKSGVRVDSYLDPTRGGHKIVKLVPKVVSYWERLFGPYPFTSAGIVVDNVPVGYALEVQTRPVFPYVPDVSTLVHELAHQWYGNSVTPADWSDIWLNEGFATYAEWLWRARTRPGYPHLTFQSLYDMHPARDPFWDIPVAEPGDGAHLFGDAVYTRGAMALQAIRMRIGNEAFFRLLKRWQAIHHEGTATTADLESLAERLSGKQLDRLFHVWLYVAAKPAGYSR